MRKKGLTYQGAREWINIGFAPGDYRWIKKGIKSGYTSQTYSQLFLSPQKWIEIFFPLEKRIKYEELNDMPLWLMVGELVISDWPSLTLIDNWKKTSSSSFPLQLTIINCPQLTLVELDKIYLTRLVITNCSQLETIYASNNQLTSESLTITNCPKLNSLSIDNNKIDSGLEFLPESLEKLYCDGNKLVEQLVDYEKWGEGGVQYYDYHLWRKDYDKSLQIKTLKEENLNLSSLKNEIERLTNLIKEQKEKIITAYTHFFQEKELLQQLITAHLEYRKAPKGGKSKLSRQRQKIYDELAEKVDENLMDEVESILEDCEQLIHYEKELQYQILIIKN